MAPTILLVAAHNPKNDFSRFVGKSPRTDTVVQESTRYDDRRTLCFQGLRGRLPMRSITTMFSPATIATRIRLAYKSFTSPKRRRQTGHRPAVELLETRELMSVTNPSHSIPVSRVESDGLIVLPDGSYTPGDGIRGQKQGQDVNDQTSEAIPVGGRTKSKTFVGSIENARDVDLYQLTVNAGERLAFDTDVPGKLDSVVRLFDSRGVQIAINNNAASPGESFSLGSYIDHTFASGGTFFVGVSGRGNSRYNPISGSGDRRGSSGDYYLTIRDGSPTTGPRPPKPFDTQNNNSRDKAEHIGSFRSGNHDPMYFGWVGTQSDRADWVKFDVDGSTSGRIRASGRTSRNRIAPALYVTGPEITLSDSNGRLVSSADSSRPRADEIKLNGLPPGIYFIRIRTENTLSAGRAYSLNMDLKVS
jgi:hypothetical protein